jgi:predicted transcriptional regulator
MPGSIFVSIVHGTAAARPLSNRPCHFRLQHPTGAAHLAAREPAVDLDHGLSVHRRFHLYGLDRVSDTGVAQDAGKVVVFNHAAQVEVLHWIMLEAIRQYVEREEKREAFKEDALCAWEAYQQTGLHLTLEEADDWLAKLEASEDADAPR